MNKKAKFVLILLIFVLLFVVAGFLYADLADSVDSNQLIVEEQDKVEESESVKESSQTDESETAENKTSQESQSEANKVESLDFTVYDKDGKEVHLFDFKGKPVVLNFWASWCGPCQMEMPDFQEKYEELGEKVQFLMVNMTTGRETKDSADAFLAEQGYSFPVFYDQNGDAASTYGAYSLPTSYFIDAEGYIVARATGMIDGETLEEAIELIYKQ